MEGPQHLVLLSEIENTYNPKIAAFSREKKWQEVCAYLNRNKSGWASESLAGMTGEGPLLWKPLS
jgi:hypothetical protein